VHTLLPALSYHAALLDLNGSFEVRAVFPRTWHLRAADRSIVTVTAGPWNGPLTVRVARRSLEGLSVRPGTAARLRDGALEIGPMRVSLELAIAWAPGPHASPLSPAALRKDIAVASERAHVADRGGLGAFTLQPASRDSGGRPSVADVGISAWLLRGWAEIAALPDAILLGDAEAMGRQTHGLLGLGPGLTPSGDDVLCGLLSGLSVLGERAPVHIPRCASTRMALARAALAAADRTTALSRTLLRWAAQGVAAEPLLAVLSTLGSDGSLEGLDALLATGHSSGSDMLTGALLAGTAVLRWEEAFGPALVRSP
jgi:hypothetical protein